MLNRNSFLVCIHRSQNKRGSIGKIRKKEYNIVIKNIALTKVCPLTFLHSLFSKKTLLDLFITAIYMARTTRADSILTWMQLFVRCTKLLSVKDTNFMERFIR